MKKIIIIAVVLAALAAVAGYLYTGKKSLDPKDYVVEKAHVGDITSSVSATGKLQAKVTVLVGTEVSGTIRQIMVDYNYPVKKGRGAGEARPGAFQGPGGPGAGEPYECPGEA